MLFKSKEQKLKKAFDDAIACGPEAMVDYLGHWKLYNEKLKFKDDVPLEDIVYSFTMPLAEFTRRRYPAVMKVPPQIFINYVFAAVEASGSHDQAMCEQAKARFVEKYLAQG